MEKNKTLFSFHTSRTVYIFGILLILFLSYGLNYLTSGKISYLDILVQYKGYIGLVSMIAYLPLLYFVYKLIKPTELISGDKEYLYIKTSSGRKKLEWDDIQSCHYDDYTFWDETIKSKRNTKKLYVYAVDEYVVNVKNINKSIKEVYQHIQRVNPNIKLTFQHR